MITPDNSIQTFLINENGAAYEESELVEKQISCQSVFKGHVFSVEIAEVLLRDGTIARREIVSHNGGAAIVPIDDQGNVYMVRQYRHALGKVMLEIPAGKLEPNEDPALCAIRELKEETGLKSNHVESLGVVAPTPGYCSERLYLFLATGLVQGNSNPDTGEYINVHRIPIKVLLNQIDTGEITDAKTIVALLKTARRLGF
jgi:ADP-ribose pyrophosphatase